MIYGYEGKDVYEFPLIAWYLEGEHRILVDTGGSAPDSVAGRKAAPYKRTPEQEIDRALAAIGVSPEEIDYVILTHLHWDHAGNNHFFKHAPMYCQKSEIDGLRIPENASKGYDHDYISGFDYELVDGDQQLFDGISVMLTPGHTPGMQCVIVDTKEGKAILSGDLITVEESLAYEPPRFNALLYIDAASAMAQRSLDRVLSLSRHILPGHDPAVFRA